MSAALAGNRITLDRLVFQRQQLHQRLGRLTADHADAKAVLRPASRCRRSAGNCCSSISSHILRLMSAFRPADSARKGFPRRRYRRSSARAAARLGPDGSVRAANRTIAATITSGIRPGSGDITTWKSGRDTVKRPSANQGRQHGKPPPGDVNADWGFLAGLCRGSGPDSRYRERSCNRSLACRDALVLWHPDRQAIGATRSAALLDKPAVAPKSPLSFRHRAADYNYLFDFGRHQTEIVVELENFQMLADGESRKPASIFSRSPTTTIESSPGRKYFFAVSRPGRSNFSSPGPPC